MLLLKKVIPTTKPYSLLYLLYLLYSYYDYFIKSAQMQIIEEELAVHYTIPQLLSRSMGKDCQKTMKQIGKYSYKRIRNK